ncbi:coagulation factor XIII B chain isoform X2 [Zonotrichia albicollis]|uniref:coagulation factor XIII B chain isoform X2 n=1 Tax=Zonotrichia albicollis TaxID=44394 RepID=UPI003D810686
METVKKMRFKSYFIFLVMVCSRRLFAEDTPCDLPQIENGNLPQYYYSFKSYYFPMDKGKKLSYSCVVGYTTESGTQDGRITCTAKGWSPVPRCYRKCTKPLLENGSFYSTEMDFKIHEKLQYKCNPGYLTLSGAAEDTVQCQPQGWSSQPSCTKTLDIKNKCPPPPLPRGHFSTARTYHNGDKVNVQCTLGRKGSEEIQCEGGKWTSPSICIGAVDNQESGTAPPPLEADAETRANQSHHNEDMKMQQDCASPPVVKNGAVLGPVLASYKNGSWVEYVCQYYHILDGPSTVYCHQGNWTEQPTCLEPCTLNVTDMDSNNLTLKWRREELVFLHGDLIEFECKQGFSFLQTAIPSPGRTQCDQGRLNYPKCAIQAATEKCGSPPSIANGALTVPALPQYDSGSSVQYICSEYHFLQGSERIYCSEGQWTSPPVCIEPCTLSKTEMEKNNVLLQAFYADQVYFYHGDYVGFYCKQNHFGAESGTTLFQVQCERGQLAYPRCVEREKQVRT